jgi:transcriptional regulator with XRE-family HTH domain
MKREDLIKSKEYLLSQLQLRILNLIGSYKDKRKLKDYELAEKLGVSKSYVSQLLNASFDHKLSKVVDLSLACDAVPLLFFVDKKDFISNDKKDMKYEVFPVTRYQNMNYENNSGDQSINPTTGENTTSTFSYNFCKV